MPHKHMLRAPTLGLIAGMGFAGVAITATGCSSNTSTTVSSQPEQVLGVAPQIGADKSVDKPILLREAMLLRKDAKQNVRIRMHDLRTMVGKTFPKTTHSLDVRLDATLKHSGTNDEGETTATLRFDRLMVTLSAIEPQEKELTYDSAMKDEDQNNPLAKMMAAVKGAECSLVIGPSGRLRELSGLNARWSAARMLIAPPALMAAQWQFTDTQMHDLIAEALFPVMPAGEVKPGDAWEFTVPANLPLQARINAKLRCQLGTPMIRDPENPEFKITGKATLEPATDLISNQPPALKPTVTNAKYEVTQTVCPSLNALKQKRDLKMDVELLMLPPKGDQILQMTIHRERTIEASRSRP